MMKCGRESNNNTSSSSSRDSSRSPPPPSRSTGRRNFHRRRRTPLRDITSQEIRIESERIISCSAGVIVKAEESSSISGESCNSNLEHNFSIISGNVPSSGGNKVDMSSSSSSNSNHSGTRKFNNGSSKNGTTNTSILSITTSEEEVRVWIESIDVGRLEEMLKSNRLKIDSMDVGGMTLLHRSVLANRLEIVRLLVRLGANASLANRDGWSPLHLAAHAGNSDILGFLLKLS